MRFLRLLVLLAPAASLWAQQAARPATPLPPLKLAEILQFISEPGLLTDPNELYEAVRRTGIDFILDEPALAAVLDGARKGQQSDAFTARLITELLQSCVGCRDRYFGPLSMEDVLSIINRSLPRQVLLDEVRLRGTKNIPPTEGTIRQLQLGGAPPELIALIVPDDQIEIPAPPGFTRYGLVRAPNYSLNSPTGVLNIKISLKGKVDLIFVNNALFYRPAAPMSEIGDLGASFNTPAPSSEAQPSIESFNRLDKPGGAFKSVWDKSKATVIKGQPPPNVEFATNLEKTGRSGLRIMIEESDKKMAHTYEIGIQWNRSAK